MAGISKWIPLGIALLILCFWGGFLLSLCLPFLLGLVIARAAEPAVCRAQRILPRQAASGVGVLLTLILGTGLLSALGAVAVALLTRTARALPDIRTATRQSMTVMQDFLVRLTGRAPVSLRPLLEQAVGEFFRSGSAALDQAGAQLTHYIGSILSRLPGHALSLGTAILAGFLISARLPRIRQAIRTRLPQQWKTAYLPALRRGKKAVGCWFLAQGKLSAVTFLLVCCGLLLLKIPYAPLWAVLVALVDAVPMLGTGTVLMPWAGVSLLQQKPGTALGLTLLYLAAMVTRSVLEPRLLGRQLGLDPLVTLIFLYLGYRFWGVWGMLFFPMIAGACKSASA